MANFSQTHPQLAAKIADQIEYGLDPEQIIKNFKEADERKELEAEERNFEETFADEIMIISQALAYRDATTKDCDELVKLLDAAYKQETIGEEAFREGDPISPDLIRSLLCDGSYHWLLIEAPSGRDIEKDGVVLGAACFSTDGVSRRNGQVEGKLGSIRLFGVLPRYHGFCVGRRLLSKVEQEMKRLGCCKSMACVPSCRKSVMEWIDRRNYVDIGSIPYPAGIGHTLRPGFSDTELVRFVKDLLAQTAANSQTITDANLPKKLAYPEVKSSELPREVAGAVPPTQHRASPIECSRDEEPFIPDVD